MAKPITIKITGDTKGFSSALGEAQTKLGKFASGIGDVFKAGAVTAAAAGAAIGGALVKGTLDAMNLQAGNDRLAAQLGLTPEEAEQYGRISGKLYADAWGESTTEVNAGLSVVSKNLGSFLEPGDAALEETTKLVLALGDTFDSDLSMTAQAASRLIASGLVDGPVEALDLLTKGMQGPANGADDLLETFQEYSTVFRDGGLSGAAAMGLLEQAMNAGARSGDVAADALKEFAIRGQDASVASKAAYASIGLDADEMTRKVALGGETAFEALDEVLDGLRAMEDPVARNAAAVGLFGTKAEDLGDALFAMDPSEAVAALGDFEGAAENMADTLSGNAATKLEAFKRKALMGLADFAARYVLPAVERLTDWASRTLPPVIEGATRIFEQRILPVLRTFAAWLSQNLPPVLEAMRSAFAAVVAWIEANWPKIAEIFDQVREVIAGAVEVITAAVQWFFDLFESGTEGVEGNGEKLREVFTAIWETAQTAFEAVRTVIETVVNVVGALWGAFGDEITAVAKRYVAYVLDQVRALASGLRAVFDLIKAVLTGKWGEAWDAVKRIMSSAVTVLKNAAGLIRDGIVAAFKTLGALLKSAVSGAFSAVRDWITGRIQSFTSAGASLGRAIVNGLKNALGALGSIGSTIGDGLINAFKSAWNATARFINNKIPDKISIPGPIPDIDLPDNPVPTFAMGGVMSRDGFARVGERGSETVYLPRGSRVIPNHATPSGAGVTVNVQTSADPWEVGREVAWTLKTAGV